MTSLPSIRPGLLRHRLEDQILVYDALDDRIHLLGETTARVLDLLDQPGQTTDGVLAELAKYADRTSSEALLALCIEELGKAGLLSTDSAASSRLPDPNRRELVRRIAVSGVAALAVPAIVTLTATAAYGQGSCIPIGSLCTCENHASCCVGSNGGRHCHSVAGQPCACHDT